jgi:hypothetical protein
VGGELSRDVLGVLDRDRDTQERRLLARVAAPCGLVCLGERLLGAHGAKGVQRPVEPLDPLQIELDQLARGDLPRPDQLGLARQSREGKVGVRHGPRTLAGWPA